MKSESRVFTRRSLDTIQSVTTYATGYVRLSAAADATNLSLGGMVADVERLAQHLGVHLIAMHVDDGLSGAIRDRPAFTAWLDDVRLGRATVMLTWATDRLTREGINAAALVMDVVEGKDPATGAVVRPPARLVDVGGLDSDVGDEAFRFRFLIAAEVARGERQRMKARSRAMHDRLKASGRWNGGQPPFGMTGAPDPAGPGKILVVDPVEAETLELIADGLILGRAPGTIARSLNADGHATRTGAKWNRNTVVEVIEGDGAGVLPAGKRVAARQAIEARRTRPHNRTGRPPRLLTGLAKCSGCGRGLITGSGGGVATYKCSSKSLGRECPASVAISAARLEEHVTAEYLSHVGWLKLTESYTITTGPEARILAAEQARTSALADLTRRASQDAFDRLSAAEAELLSAASEPTNVETRSRATGQTVAEAWLTHDDSWRRNLLAQWPVTISVLPGNRHGGRHFDSGRILIEWTEEAYAYEEEDYSPRRRPAALETPTE